MPRGLSTVLTVAAAIGSARPLDHTGDVLSRQRTRQLTPIEIRVPTERTSRSSLVERAWAANGRDAAAAAAAA